MHSRFSPSKAERWLNCTAYPLIKDRYPEEKSSLYAIEGTAAHKLINNILRYRSYDEQSLRDLIGKPIRSIVSTDQTDLIYTVDMHESICIYIRHIIEKTKQIGGVYYPEIKVFIESISSEMFGTADTVIVGDNELAVFDYKHGVGVTVEAEQNPQIAFYALAALEKFTKKYKKITMGVIQPRDAHNKNPIRSVETTPAELYQQWYTRFKSAHEEILFKPVIRPGSWCRWCEADMDCSELAKLGKGLMKVDFNSISDIDRLQILNNSATIRLLLSEIDKWAYAKLYNGDQLEGWKLVRSFSNRKWKDEQQIIEKFGKKAITEKLISPSQAEKKFPADRPWIEEQCKTDEKDPILVKSDDKRMGFSPVKSDFGGK